MMIETVSCADCSSRPPKVSDRVKLDLASISSTQESVNISTHHQAKHNINIKQALENKIPQAFPAAATTATPSSAAADLTSAAAVSTRRATYSNTNQSHQNLASSRLSYFRPQPATTLTIATPHHRQQHRLLLAPQLLFPSTGFGGLANHQYQNHHHHQQQLQLLHNGNHHHHHYHQSAATALAAAATNGNFQSLSTLSPDARACFTATYLCVLIVNNTWLDCNLLEMLCNGSTNPQKSSGSPTDSETGAGGSSEDHLHSQRSREQLEAFETILDELVAFAGGGRNEGGGGGQSTAESQQTRRPHMDMLNGSNMGLSSPRDGIYIAPVHLKSDLEPELPRQVVPPDEGGGGGGGGSSDGNASMVSLFYSDKRSAEPPSDGHDQEESKQSPRIIVARLSQLSDDDEQTSILKQYFDARRSELAAQRSAGEATQADGPSVVQENSSSTTLAPASVGSGLITNWISRPLRDWSSYLFWSPSPSAAGEIPNQTTNPANNNNNNLRNDESDIPIDANKQQNSMSVQILRPIDRTDNYNTIPTNQTSQKQQQSQLIVELPYNNLSGATLSNNHRGQAQQSGRQNGHHQAAAAATATTTTTTTRGSPLVSSSFASELADQMSIPLTTLSDLVGSSSSVTMAEIGRQPSSTSTPMQHSLVRQQQQQQQQQGIRAAPEESSFVANPISMRPAYDPSSSQPPIQIFRDSPLSQQQFQSIQQQQQKQNAMFGRPPSGAQNQFSRPVDECDCGGAEFLVASDNQQPPSAAAAAAASNLFTPAYTESCHRYCQSRALVGSAIASSTPSLLDQQSSPATSFPTTSSVSLSTSGGPVAPSGGKMNPLDVTFLLYTRRHRDLLNGADEDLLQLQSSSSPTSPAARNPSISGHASGNGGGASGSGAVNQQQQQPYNSDEADRSLNPNNSYNIGSGELLDLNNEDTLSDSSFNGSLPVKLIIHGFGSGGRRPWVTEMVYKLLDYENVNVIVVDWEKGATLPNYVQAAGNTRLVGHKIASLIRAINARHGLTASRYHLIGFSLGAHVAGFAGMEIRNSTIISHHWINRITGLDPASPLFEGYEADDRLDPSDAQFVDVIHSNGDGVLRGGFGSLQPMGHVDFYPNGGRVQVGCNSVLLSALSDIIYGKWQSLCNHRRALNFFMDSFEFDKCKFRSFNCDSYESYVRGDCFDCGLNEERCSYMGYLANYSKGRGKMYLTTHEEAPFCANQFLIKIIGTKGFKTHWGKVEVTLVGQDGRNESFWLSATSQQSNNHELSSGQKDHLVQHSMQSLIVSHLALANLTHILLRYTKYRGWIYSGGESWSIDKVHIADSDGRVKSFCGYSTVLDSHVTTALNLDAGNCTINEASMVQPTGPSGQQTSRSSAGPTTAGSNTLITSTVQQQQQQQTQTHHQQQSQQQPQPNHPRTPRMFSSMVQSMGEPQAAPILVSGHALQLRSLPANDWHQQLSQLGFGKLKASPSQLIAT